MISGHKRGFEAQGEKVTLFSGLPPPPKEEKPTMTTILQAERQNGLFRCRYIKQNHPQTFSIFPVKLHTAAPVIAMLTVPIYSGGDARSRPLAAQAQ